MTKVLQYKIDDNEEYHDVYQPSTTFCPLLPGQRLNVLEVPIQSRSRKSSTSSTSSEIHTLNPEDKYLTPKPPPIPIARELGSSYALEEFQVRSRPMLVTSTGEIIVYPQSTENLSQTRLQSVSPQLPREARDATTPPAISRKTSTGLKDLSSKLIFSVEKPSFLASELASDNDRGRTVQRRGAGRLQTAAPVLTSQTDEEGNLVPLRSAGLLQTSSNVSDVPRKILGKNFSPLGSHPVCFSTSFTSPSLSLDIKERPARRSRSLDANFFPVEIEVKQRRRRACSTPNVPMHSPDQDFSNREASKPSLVEPASPFEDMSRHEVKTAGQDLRTFGPAPAAAISRPPSRRKEVSIPNVRDSLLLDKDLPELPSFLTQDSLFHGSDALDNREPIHTFDETMTRTDPSSHFSLWSVDSIAFTSRTSDEEEEVQSPTFSSLTTSSGDCDTPNLFFDQLIPDYHASSNDDGFKGETNQQYSKHSPDANIPPSFHFDDSALPCTPFHLDIRQSESAQHRQAVYFSFPENLKPFNFPSDQTTSQVPLTKYPASLSGFADVNDLAAPHINTETETSVSQLERLMSEFSYLGEAVM